MDEAAGAVVLVPAPWAALSARACAPGRGALAEALGFSQGFPRWRLVAYRPRGDEAPRIAVDIAKLPESLRGFISPLRRSLNINRGRIVVAKTFAKMALGITALVVTTWFGTSSSRAYGDAPWCAVINLGKDVYWDCR
jgi:hypothetical protein